MNDIDRFPRRELATVTVLHSKFFREAVNDEVDGAAAFRANAFLATASDRAWKIYSVSDRRLS